jgi:hypothetical protein
MLQLLNHQEEQWNEKQVFDIMLHLFFIECIVTYFMDNSVFLLLLRGLQLLLVCKINLGPLLINNSAVMFLMALVANIPNFCSHLLLSLSQMDHRWQQENNNHILIQFFNSDAFSLILILFTDCIVLLTQCLMLMIRKNRTGRSAVDNTLVTMPLLPSV